MRCGERPAIRIAKGTPRDPWNGEGCKLPKLEGKPFEGFRWRTGDDLKLNFLHLSHYLTKNAEQQKNVENQNRTTHVWVDDIVLATDYSGPIEPVSK